MSTTQELEGMLVEAEARLEAVRTSSEGRDIVLASYRKQVEQLKRDLEARKDQCDKQHAEIVELRRLVNRYERILFIAAELRELVHSSKALDASLKILRED